MPSLAGLSRTPSSKEINAELHFHRRKRAKTDDQRPPIKNAGSAGNHHGANAARNGRRTKRACGADSRLVSCRSVPLSNNATTIERTPATGNGNAPATNDSDADGTWAKKAGAGGAGGLLVWLLDVDFVDIRLPVINRWFCRFIYSICCVGVVLFALWATAVIFRESDHPARLLALPALWLSIVPFIICVRLILEQEIILFDWITETTKAARRYNEQNK